MDGDPSAFEGKPTDLEALIADPGICLDLDFPAPDFDSNLIVPEGADGDFGFLSALGGEAGSPASLSCLEEHRTPTAAPLPHPIDVPQGHHFDPKYSGMTIPLEGRPPFTHTSVQSHAENEASVESENNIDLDSFLMSGTGPRSPLTLPTAALAQSAMPKGENGMPNMLLSGFVPSQDKEFKEAKSRREFDPASISFLFDNHSTGSVIKEDIFAYFGTSEVYSPNEEPVPSNKLCGVKKKAGTTSKKKAKKGAGKTPARAKKAKQPVQSSKHCHICARSGHKVNLAGCKNLHREPDACRKVVCRKCFATLDGVGTFEDATRPGREWECLHCMVPEGEGCAPGHWCPGHAQCKVYAKTNARRRSENLRKKRLRDAQEKARAEERRVARMEAVGQGMGVAGDGEELGEEVADVEEEGTKIAEVDTSGTGVDGRSVVLSPFGNGPGESEIEMSTLDGGDYLAW